LQGRSRLSSLLCIDNRAMVCALGGLIKVLNNNSIANNLHVSETPLHFNSLLPLEISKRLFMDKTTMSLLGIFREERNPALDKDRQKEGLSVFALLDTTKTAMGRRTLKYCCLLLTLMSRSWMLNPVSDRAILEERLNQIDMLCHGCNRDVVGEISFQLKRIKDLSKIFRRIKKAVATITDWKHLHDVG